MRKVVCITALCLIISSAQAATYTVTNTNDSGPGSLRWAIEQANDHMGPDTIVFDISPADPGHDNSQGVWWIWPDVSLPTLTDRGTYINGWTQTTNQGDLNPYGPEIVICGDSLNLEETPDSNGLSIVTSYCKITGLVVCGFPKDGILINEDLVPPDSAPATRNVVLGCYIGTGPLGEIAHPNGRHGVNIFGGLANIIGGPDSTQRNLISGNEWCGIRIDGDSNVVINNYIGCDREGKSPLGNGFHGVNVFHSATEPSHHGWSIANQIGGCGADSGNVIVANERIGVVVYGFRAPDNRIMGNWIGTNPDFDPGLGNKGKAGIHLHWIKGNYVGDTIPGAGNIIVSNSGAGILLWKTGNNVIRGNWIGTDPDTSLLLGNGEDGIRIDYATWDTPCDSNRIERNFIWYNGRDGVRIESKYSSGFIFHNTIGPSNFIWNNDSNGVLIKGYSHEDSATCGNTITKNSITNNGLKGIELDSMGNWEIEAPEIDTVYLTTNDSMVVKGTALPSSRVEVFTDPAEEGKWPHCFDSANVFGNWTFITDSLIGTYVTATATDALGNTSEFSDTFPNPNPRPGIEEEPSFVVDRGVLLETHPNPSLHGAVIFYELPKAGEISLAIYDASGRLVRLLVNGIETAGRHRINWSGKDETGREVTPGVYFCRLETDGQSVIRKLILIE